MCLINSAKKIYIYFFKNVPSVKELPAVPAFALPTIARGKICYINIENMGVR